jgi:short-subunit dehydrogenase
VTRLAGAHVLVTGATSGIGRATAFALAGRGARLTLTGRDVERLAELAHAVGGRAVPADLADPQDTARLAEAAAADGVPDVVVLNAGIGHVAPAGQTGQATLERLLRTNLAAPAQLTAALLPGLCARGSGHLVFVTSIAAHLGVPEESAYAATKAGLAAYAASLRDELAPAGVLVSTVAPGIVDTEFFARRGAPYRRRFPRPMPASRVAAEVVACIEKNRAEVVVPRWLRLPIVLRTAAPDLYARLARRWG